VVPSGPMGRQAGDRWPSTILHIFSTKNKSGRFSDPPQPLRSAADAKRDRQAAAVRGDSRSRPKRVGGGTGGDVAYVPGTPQGRPSPSGHQPKNNQSLCRTDTLQNGRIENAAQHNPASRLHGEDRFGGCIPSHTVTSIKSKVFSVPMGTNHLPVAVHAIRVPRCTTNIHSSNASDSQGGTQTRHTIDSIHGRHISVVDEPRTILQGSRLHPSVTNGVRFLDQPKEMCTETNSADGLPGSDSGFSCDDPIVTEREDNRNYQPSAQDASEGGKQEANLVTTPSKVNWSPAIGDRLRPTHSPTLQLLTRSTTFSGARHIRKHLAIPARNSRPAMVGGQLTTMERQTVVGASNRSSVRHRCIGEGMGSSLLPNQQQPITTTTSAYRMSRFLRRGIDEQYTGIECRSEWCHIIDESASMVKLFSSSANRQPSNHELHQSNGGPRTSPSSNSGGDTQLLLNQGHTIDSRIPARVGELDRRLAVEDRIRSFGIETASSAVPAPQPEVGTAYHRCLSIINQQTIGPIHQLPSRPNMSVLGPIQPTNGSEGKHMDASTSIRTDHPEMSAKDSKREAGIDHNDPSCMAYPILVAPRVVPVPGLATSATSPPIDTDQLGSDRGGEGEGKGIATVLAISRSATIRQHLQMQGFSDESVNIWFNKNKGGEHGATNIGHDKMWAKYSSWVIANGGRPYNFDVADIINYLTKVMIADRHNAASRCKTFISMCSTTHSVWFPESASLSTNTLIKGIRKGVERTRSAAKKKKQQTYYSLYKLFKYLETITDNDATAPIDKVRDKLIVLMLIDGMARSSDIASITRESISFHDRDTNKVLFNYYFPKEEKSPGEIQSSIGYYPNNTKICTMTVMKHYLSRTSELKIEQVDHIINDKIVKRTPLFIWKHKQNQSTYSQLKSERISKIGLMALRACAKQGESKDSTSGNEWKTHSIRGAASSKCVNLLPALRPAVCLRARWANEATFMKSYYKQCNYVEANDDRIRNQSLEFILRFKTTRVDC
jgi:hypothetical protein